MTPRYTQQGKDVVAQLISWSGQCHLAMNQEKTKIVIRPTLTLFYTLICCTENVKLEFIVSKSDSENITLVFPRLEKDLYDIADTSIKLRDPAEPS